LAHAAAASSADVRLCTLRRGTPQADARALAYLPRATEADARGAPKRALSQEALMASETKKQNGKREKVCGKQ
jgi:hypothetical protein